MQIIFQVIVLIYSAIIHEYMHGWMADRQGDTTAKDLGRLTMNPIPHIDPIGSLFLPLLLIATNSPFVFGWAKPVPYNPYNLRDQRFGGAKVAIAGPLANLAVALAFGLLLRFLPGVSGEMVGYFQIIVFINVLLMIFNLMPIPPLDGSKVIMPFLPVRWQEYYSRLEPYGMILVFAFVWFGFDLILPAIFFLFSILTGISV
jgi:Zn-dependent protease